jgi:hypothetical protein
MRQREVHDPDSASEQGQFIETLAVYHQQSLQGDF